MIMRWECLDRGSLREVRGKAGGGRRAEAAKSARARGEVMVYGFFPCNFDLIFFFLCFWFWNCVFSYPPPFLCCIAFGMFPHSLPFFYIQFQDHVYTYHLPPPLCDLFWLFYFSRYPFWSLLLAASAPAFAVPATIHKFVISSLFVLRISFSFLIWHTPRYDLPFLAVFVSLSSLFFYIRLLSVIYPFRGVLIYMNMSMFFFQVISLNRCHINHTRLLLNHLCPRR